MLLEVTATFKNLQSRLLTIQLGRQKTINSLQLARLVQLHAAMAGSSRAGRGRASRERREQPRRGPHRAAAATGARRRQGMNNLDFRHRRARGEFLGIDTASSRPEMLEFSRVLSRAGRTAV